MYVCTCHRQQLALSFFFFFQAEDGIRDVAVTGVQTCALPISRSGSRSCARPRRDGDVVAVRLETQDQLAELDRRAREVVFLRVDFQDTERLRHQAPKNSRTAAPTASISASLWFADIGRVRISWTSRSVRGSVGGVRGAPRRRRVGRAG